MNYLSSWIANLGVVPLFLFSAFLFLPALFTLFLRIIRVFFVLEPMTTSLSRNRPLYVTFMESYVKVFLLVFPFLCYAETTQATETIFLSKGEQKSLKVLKLGEFSIGNKDVISHKYLKDKEKFLIKGKGIGFSDLIIWSDKQKKTYHIYVTDKRTHLRNQQIKELLNFQRIPHSIKGDLVITHGKIQRLEQYLMLKKLEQNNKKTLFLQSYLGQELRNELISKVYEEIMGEGFYEISCNEELLTIKCLLNSQDKSLTPKINYLKNNYSIEFVQTNISKEYHNYKIKLKFIQFERLDGQEFSLGLDQVQTTMQSLFEKGTRALVENNLIQLAKQNISVSTLAEPEVLMQVNKKALIKVGAEIPFSSLVSSSNIISQTQWKFSGLQVKLALKKNKSGHEMEYQTSLTSPDAQNIKGSKESSSLFVKINKPITLFKIAFRSSARTKKSIPLLGDIPLLGRIFQSSNHQRNYKHIYGYLKVENHE